MKQLPHIFTGCEILFRYDHRIEQGIVTKINGNWFGVRVTSLADEYFPEGPECCIYIKKVIRALPARTAPR